MSCCASLVVYFKNTLSLSIIFSLDKQLYNIRVWHSVHFVNHDTVLFL